jgi:hypothetical protein
MILVNITLPPKAAWALIVAVALFAASASCGMPGPSRTSVWVENRSSKTAAFFVTDLSDGPAGWYIVPGNMTARAGSDGLRFSDVRVNVLGWGYEARNAPRCSPGDYDDTLYDVPEGSFVRLVIDETGQPSVGVAPEPPGLPRLSLAPLGPMSEADRCQYIDTHQ